MLNECQRQNEIAGDAKDVSLAVIYKDTKNLNPQMFFYRTFPNVQRLKPPLLTLTHRAT